jgi:hypothetical protein
LWYERKISDLEARILDFDDVGKLPPGSLPPCGEGMFLDWYGMPQLDLTYALMKIAEIPGFNVNGLFFEDLQVMVNEAMETGISGAQIAMQLADQIQVAPGGITLMDLQYIDFDQTQFMNSILGSIVNNDMSGWYMDTYGQVVHPSWEFYYVDYEFNDWDDDSWYQYYGDDWEEYYNEWSNWYEDYGYEYYGEYEYVSEYDDDYWEWWYAYYDQGEFYYDFYDMYQWTEEDWETHYGADAEYYENYFAEYFGDLYGDLEEYFADYQFDDPTAGLVGDDEFGLSPDGTFTDGTSTDGTFTDTGDFVDDDFLGVVTDETTGEVYVNENTDEVYLYECDYYNNWCADIADYVLTYDDAVEDECDYWNDYCGAYTYTYGSTDATDFANLDGVTDLIDGATDLVDGVTDLVDGVTDGVDDYDPTLSTDGVDDYDPTLSTDGVNDFIDESGDGFTDFVDESVDGSTDFVDESLSTDGFTDFVDESVDGFNDFVDESLSTDGFIDFRRKL